MAEIDAPSPGGFPSPIRQLVRTARANGAARVRHRLRLPPACRTSPVRGHKFETEFRIEPPLYHPANYVLQ